MKTYMDDETRDKLSTWHAVNFYINDNLFYGSAIGGAAALRMWEQIRAGNPRNIKIEPALHI